MKQITFIITIVMCLFFSKDVVAQRMLPGMRGLQIIGGLTNPYQSDSKWGGYCGLGISTYTKAGNKWLFGGEFLQKSYPYKTEQIPLSQFTVEGGYYRRILSDPTKTVHCSFGTSILTGYETVNWGEKTLFDGSTLQNKDRFLYGGAFTLEMENYLSDRIILLLSIRERILWGSSTGHFHTQFGIGLKYIIN